MTNDSRVVEGDVYDLCVPGKVASPLVLEKPGVEQGGFHGAFWIAPRESSTPWACSTSASRERSSRTTTTSSGYGRRVSKTVQIPSVRVWSRRIGLTMSKLPDKGQGWLASNERRFEEKWGWVPPVTDPDASLDEP